MFCQKCGESLQADSKFCVKCGRPTIQESVIKLKCLHCGAGLKIDGSKITGNLASGRCPSCGTRIRIAKCYHCGSLNVVDEVEAVQSKCTNCHKTISSPAKVSDASARIDAKVPQRQQIQNSSPSMNRSSNGVTDLRASNVEQESNNISTKTPSYKQQKNLNSKSHTASDTPNVTGINGWLILPAIGFVFGMVALPLTLLSIMASPKIDGFICIIFFCFCLFFFYTAILFFKKRENAPTMTIILLLAYVAIDALLYFIAKSTGAHAYAAVMSRNLLIMVANAAVWIPYYLLSKRVKATFVN